METLEEERMRKSEDRVIMEGLCMRELGVGLDCEWVSAGSGSLRGGVECWTCPGRRDYD